MIHCEPCKLSLQHQIVAKLRSRSYTKGTSIYAISIFCTTLKYEEHVSSRIIESILNQNYPRNKYFITACLLFQIENKKSTAKCMKTTNLLEILSNQLAQVQSTLV